MNKMDIQDWLSTLVKLLIAVMVVLAIAWFGFKVPPQEVPATMWKKVVSFGKTIQGGAADLADSSRRLEKNMDDRSQEANDIRAGKEKYGVF